LATSFLEHAAGHGQWLQHGASQQRRNGAVPSLSHLFPWLHRGTDRDSPAAAGVSFLGRRRRIGTGGSPFFARLRAHQEEEAPGYRLTKKKQADGWISGREGFLGAEEARGGGFREGRARERHTRSPVKRCRSQWEFHRISHVLETS
jgi:hypothetical protein